MRSQAIVPFAFGVLVAACAALLIHASGGLLPRAQAAPESTADAGSMTVVAATTANDQSRTFFVLDAETKRFCIYELRAGRLVLVAARNACWDFLLDELPAANAQNSQLPTVSRVHDMVEDSEQQHR